MDAILLLLPILLPVLGGLLVMWAPCLKVSRTRRIFVLAVLALHTALILLVFTQPDLRWEAMRYTGTLSVLLKTDALSRLFTALVSVIWLIAGIYALSYMEHEEHRERFFLFFLVTLGALTGLGFAGNYMTLYLFFEVMTLASMPMVLHSMTREAIGAAKKYLFYSIAGASMALVGFFLLVNLGGAAEFTAGGILTAQSVAGQEGVVLVSAMLAIMGFGAKAGLFPLHAWLPTAHPVAPSPASAVLSGIITKAGVLAIIRVVFYQFGADFIRGTWVQYVWIALCLITVLLGSVLAFRAQQLKKRLAYSSVSQVSYVLFGLSLLTAGGMMGALLHLVFHAIIKNGLFMAIGAIILLSGKTGATEMRAMGVKMPAVMWCFTLLSTALIGIPPLSGAVSKWALATGALAADVGVFSWIGPVVLLVSALLTAGYLLSIVLSAFFPGAEFDKSAVEKAAPAKQLLFPLILLTGAACWFGMFPGPLMGLLATITGGLF